MASLSEITTDSALDAEDGNVVSSLGCSSDNCFLMQFFNSSINVKDYDVTNISWRWVGRGESIGQIFYGYFWNYTSSEWVQCIDSFSTTSNKNKSCEKIGNVTNLINSNNLTNFMMWINSSTSTSKQSYIDYISLSLTYDGIQINSPTSSQEILNNLSTILNTSQSGYNTSWYSWNNGISNTTLCTNSLECQSTITFPRQGYYNLTVYSNKSDGTQTSKVVSNLFVGNNTLIDYGKTQFRNNITSCSIGSTGIPDNLVPPTCDSYIVDFTSSNAINLSDNVYISTQLLANERFYIMPTFNISPLGNINVKKINYTIEGYESEGVSKRAYFSLFNYSSNSWLNVVNLITGSDKKLSYVSESDNSMFINNSLISLLFYETNDNTNTLNMDYASLNITYSSQNSPSIVTSILSNNSNFSAVSSVGLTYNISDDNDYVLYSKLFLNNQLNQTINFPALGTTLNFTFGGINDGIYNYTIEVTDSDNAKTNLTRVFTIDTTAPLINIVYPTDYFTLDYSLNIPINYTIVESGVGYSLCWWTNSSGASNYTITCGDNFTVGESGDGDYQVTIYANDTLNNLGSATVHYSVSTTNPIVNLYLPSNHQWLNYNLVTFNFTFLDAHLNSVAELWGNWTSIWHKNQTLGVVSNNSVVVNFIPVSLLDGRYIWNVWANETNGLSDWNNINWTVNVDTIFPQLTLVHPQNTTYTSNSLSLNYSVSDLNLDTCKYSINSGLTNYTLSSCNNITYSANQGSTTLFVYATDLASNLNSTNVTFFVDSIKPSIIFSGLTNATYLNYNQSVIVNLTISDTNLNTCWYNLDNGANTTIACGTNLTLNVSDESIHTINAFANDTLNNINNTRLSFYSDTKYPIVTIFNLATTSGSQTFTFDNTVTDAFPNTCKYSILDSTGAIDGLYENISVICGASGTSATVSSFGTFTLLFYATDKSGNENSTNQSFTTTSAVTLSVSGGGGSAEEKIPVIGIETFNKNYTNLQKEIIYANIVNYCSDKIKTTSFAVTDYSDRCLLSDLDLSSIIPLLKEEGVIIDLIDLKVFYNGFKNSQLFQGFESIDTIKKYSLFASKLGFTTLLQIVPSSFNQPQIIFDLDGGSHTINLIATSNKPLQLCDVLNNPNIECNVQNSSIKVKVSLSETNFFSRTLSGSVSVITEAPQDQLEQKTIPINLTIYNLANIQALITLGILSITLIGGFVYFARRKTKLNLNKALKLE